MKENIRIEAAKIQSLMERLERPHTYNQALLNESRLVNEATTPTRELKSAEEIISVLDSIGVNKFVSVGYVTAANMDTPIKKKNPATNRMKGYPDWEGFASSNNIEGKVGGLVKITSYNFRYNTANSVNTKYEQYKTEANKIRAKYGVGEMGSGGYKDNLNYGNGVKTYAGSNENLKGKLYSDQNIYGANIQSMYYPVDHEGHIITSLDKSQVVNFLKQNTYSRDSGLNTLKKMNAEESVINAYKQDMDNLKFKYMSFDYDKILYIAATVDGQKIVYINNKLSLTVENEININPQDFIAIAKARYADSLQKIEAESQTQEEGL